MFDIEVGSNVLILVIIFWKNKGEWRKEKNNYYLLNLSIGFFLITTAIDFIGLHTSEKYQFLNLSEYQQSLISAIEETFKTLGFGSFLMWVLNIYQRLLRKNIQV